MIKRIVTYFIVVTTALYALRYLHYKGLLMQKAGYYNKLSTAFLQPNNYDVLFLGSSRAEMHCNTRIFDSLTGSNSFNLGMPGASPQVAFAILKTYLNTSKKPGTIFYELDCHLIPFKDNAIIDFNNFFPFLSNKTLRTEFNKIDNRMKHFYYNSYYSMPYSGLKNISTSLHGWLNIATDNDKNYYKGTFEENFTGSLNYIEDKRVNIFISLLNRNYLDSITTLCTEQKINLIWFTSPVFGSGNFNAINKTELKKQIKNMVQINKLVYYDFSAHPLSANRNCFLDIEHMKLAGTRIFTRELARIFNNKR